MRERLQSICAMDETSSGRLFSLLAKLSKEVPPQRIELLGISASFPTKAQLRSDIEPMTRPRIGSPLREGALTFTIAPSREITTHPVG